MVIKDSKKMKITEEPPELDRLSDLPDTLLLHILSFLNTQYAVQTSVLAKRWKLLWTFLPDLHLQRLPSYKLSSFEKFVINVFSRRRNSTIRRLRFLRPGILFGNLPSKVCDYAMWHGVQHLNIGLGGMAIKPFTVPSELFTCPSLETLELRYISIYVPSAAGPFSMPRLAVLRLRRCEFRCWFKDPYVLIGGCPNLATLFVESSSGLKSLKISAQQLVDLTIVSDSSDPVSKIEVDAPKLQNYSCTLGFIDDMQCCLLKGPTCLENVFLDLDFRRKALQNSEKEKLVLKAVNVLQGVGSVQFLTLSCRFFQVLEMAPVVLVRQPSPFSRLKMLQFQHSDCETLTVSALLVLYFLKACPRASVDLKFNKMKTPLAR